MSGEANVFSVEAEAVVAPWHKPEPTAGERVSLARAGSSRTYEFLGRTDSGWAARRDDGVVSELSPVEIRSTGYLTDPR